MKRNSVFTALIISSNKKRLKFEWVFIIKATLYHICWLHFRTSRFFPIWAVSDTFQFWHFPIRAVSDTFKFWHFPNLMSSDTFQLLATLTLSNSDTFRFWHFPILTLSNSDTFQFCSKLSKNGFWHFPILTLSNLPYFAPNRLIVSLNVDYGKVYMKSGLKYVWLRYYIHPHIEGKVGNFYTLDTLTRDSQGDLLK